MPWNASYEARQYASHVRLASILPVLCPMDQKPLKEYPHVIFELDGMFIDTAAKYCPVCKTVYLTPEAKKNILGKFLVNRIDISSPIPNPVPSKPAVEKPSSQKASHEKPKNPSGSVYFLQSVPVLTNRVHKCHFCGKPLTSDVPMPCMLYKSTGKMSIKKVPLYRCRTCGAMYISEPQLVTLNKIGITINTVQPDRFNSAYKMMEAVRKVMPHHRGNSPIESLSFPSSNSTKAMAQKSDSLQQEHTSTGTRELARIPTLDSPQTVCPFCKEALRSKVHIKYPSYHWDGTVVTKYAHLWECRRCQAVFADQEQFSNLCSWNNDTRFETVSALQYGSAAQMMAAASRTAAQEAALGKSLPFADYGKETENLSDGSRVVQVYARKCHCQKCRSRYQRDTMVNRTAIVETVRSGEVRINVMFCKGCGQYFVSLPALEQYRELYGGLLMEFRPASDLSVEDCGRFNFAPDTILSRCGYSVKSGITPEYRHAVLRYILESGKAQKYEIIEKINGFIRLRDRNPIFSNACERWREDIQFVSNYRIGQQKSVRGLTFKKG